MKRAYKNRKRIGAVLFFVLLGGTIISSEAFTSFVVTAVGVVLVVAIAAGGLFFDVASQYQDWKRKN